MLQENINKLICLINNIVIEYLLSGDNLSKSQFLKSLISIYNSFKSSLLSWYIRSKAESYKFKILVYLSFIYFNFSL